MMSKDSASGELPAHVPPSNPRRRAVVNNHNRAAVFRKWVIDTFPAEYLKLILDVAGGKGEVSVPLALAGYNCIVIDPRECDWSKNRIVKNLQFHLQARNTKTYYALAERVGEERLEREGLPVPRRLLEYFTADDAAFADEIMLLNPNVRVNPPDSTEESRDFACKSGVDELNVGSPQISSVPDVAEGRITIHSAKRDGTILLGMHSDEATEPIVDFAIRNKRPFAVVPCCVFPKDNPHRRHPETGGKVESYADFVAYLKAKQTLCGSPIQETSLAFDGRNTVLYYVPSFGS